MNKMRSVLFVLIASVVLAGCSTTEWEEMEICNEEVSYTNWMFDCRVSAQIDQATISFAKPRTGMIYLNGIYLDDFNEKSSYTIRNLEPNETYEVRVVCKDGNKIFSRTIEFTTSKPYITLMGCYVMDPYEYEEKALGAICLYSDGGCVDHTYNYVRRLDANGDVMWRTKMSVFDIVVSNEGGIAVLSSGDHRCASRLDPVTGAELYKCRPTDDAVTVVNAYPCNNGGMALVGQKWIHHYDEPNEEYYYFGLFDANGAVVNEEYGSDATYLYKVVETTDGKYVAIGKKWSQTLALVTFNDEGKQVSSDSEYSEYRNLDCSFNVHDVKKDNDGAAYFLLDEEVDSGCYYSRALVVRVNEEGNIVWTRPLVANLSSCAYTISILDENRLLVTFGVDDGSYNFKTAVVTLSKDNEILSGNNLGVSLSPIFVCPLNHDGTELYIYGTSGNVIYVDLDAPHDIVPLELKEGW